MNFIGLGLLSSLDFLKLEGFFGLISAGFNSLNWFSVSEFF